jgi:hypothetical protein
MFMWMLHDGVLNKTASHYQVWKCVTWCSKQDCFSLSSFENVYVNGPECYMLLLILKFENVYVNATWCSKQDCFSLSSFENVYVNVTCCFSIISQVWKCLCECYMLLLILSSLKMFMWMLHAASHSLKFPKCLCKCYMAFVINYFSLSSFENVYVNVTCCFSIIFQVWKCLCECYMLFLFSQVLKMFMWMLHDVLNKTASHSQFLKMIMWMLHVASHSLKFSKCLCECYIMFETRLLLILKFWKCLCECYSVFVIKLLLIIVKFPKCLCKCYMAFVINYFSLSSFENVYVNVTCCSYSLKFWKCLCECYMMF